RARPPGRVPPPGGRSGRASVPPGPRTPPRRATRTAAGGRPPARDHGYNGSSSGHSLDGLVRTRRTAAVGGVPAEDARSAHLLAHLPAHLDHAPLDTSVTVTFASRGHGTRISGMPPPPCGASPRKQGLHRE